MGNICCGAISTSHSKDNPSLPSPFPDVHDPSISCHKNDAIEFDMLVATEILNKFINHPSIPIECPFCVEIRQPMECMELCSCSHNICFKCAKTWIMTSSSESAGMTFRCPYGIEVCPSGTFTQHEVRCLIGKLLTCSFISK